MTPAPKKRGRLTPLERLVNASVGGILKHRRMAVAHGKKHHGLKIDTVKLAYVRLAGTQGKVITATSLADDMLVSPRETASGLKRLVNKGLIVAKDKIGREVEYENPEGYTYPPWLIDDMVELVPHQIGLARQLEKLVAKLDDPTLKDRFTKAIEVAIEAVKLNTF